MQGIYQELYRLSRLRNIRYEATLSTLKTQLRQSLIYGTTYLISAGLYCLLLTDGSIGYLALAIAVLVLLSLIRLITILSFITKESRYASVGSVPVEADTTESFSKSDWGVQYNPQKDTINL